MELTLFNTTDLPPCEMKGSPVVQVRQHTRRVKAADVDRVKRRDKPVFRRNKKDLRFNQKPPAHLNISDLQKKILENLRAHGPMTADECAEKMNENKYNVRPRMSELHMKFSLVRETGEKRGRFHVYEVATHE